MSIELTSQERNSPLALRLTAHLIERLDNERRRNDAPLPPEQTAHARGKIAELKAFIELLAVPGVNETE